MRKVTKAAIYGIASPEVIERGEDYYEAGTVLSLIRRGDQLQASGVNNGIESPQINGLKCPLIIARNVRSSVLN